jgi:hypothetical protein
MTGLHTRAAETPADVPAFTGQQSAEEDRWAAMWLLAQLRASAAQREFDSRSVLEAVRLIEAEEQAGRMPTSLADGLQTQIALAYLASVVEQTVSEYATAMTDWGASLGRFVEAFVDRLVWFVRR